MTGSGSTPRNMRALLVDMRKATVALERSRGLSKSAARLLIQEQLEGRLGTRGETIDDWNQVYLDGFYHAFSGAANAPTANTYSGIVQNVRTGTSYRTFQRVIRSDSADEYERWSTDGGASWDPWKAVNLQSRDFTPSIQGGATVGNGTIIGSYSVNSGLVTGIMYFTLGSTSAVTGDFSFARPTGIANSLPWASAGRAVQGSNFSPLQILVASGRIWVRWISGGSILNLNSTRPNSWSAGHTIEAPFSYPTY